MPDETPQPERREGIQKRQTREIEGVYFNGFTIAVGNADVSLQLRIENQPVMMLKMSYTVAKTLGEMLHARIGDFERITHHPLMTTRETLKALQAEAARLKAEKEKTTNTVDQK